MEEEDNSINLQDIEKEISNKDQENQYLKSRNLGLQDAVEGNFMPRPDSNVIEYKLSSEELLERIEHYLKGDILKTRTNEEGQVETYYSVPTKKISVALYRNEINKIVYVVDEHFTDKGGWKILCVWEKDEDKNMVEIEVEENYHDSLMSNLMKGLESKAKKKKIKRLGMASKEIPDEDRKNLNSYGVQEVMNILSMYITKETFLSFYKEDRIYEIVGDLGDALNKFFLINSKAIGLDTEYKKTKYPMMVINILHSVENAYRRALMGNENKGTREGIIVTQHQNPSGSFPTPQILPQKKKWSLLDRSTW